MRNFILSRLAAMVAILVALTAVMFVLQHISPLDPVKAQLGANASAETVAARRQALGLDQPLVNQFWQYLIGAVHGDLGTSYRTRHPVSSDLGSFSRRPSSSRCPVSCWPSCWLRCWHSARR